MPPRDACRVTRRCYSVADLVELGIGSRTTIYRLRRDGLLPFRRVGRRVVVTSADLEAFLDAARADG